VTQSEVSRCAPIGNPSKGSGQRVARATFQKNFQAEEGPQAGTRSSSAACRKPVDFLKAGLFALIGLVVTRQLPQVVLKDPHKGRLCRLRGQRGDGRGRRLWRVQVHRSKPAGAAVAMGGALYLVNRILSPSS
jgi:hypothetical protein